MRDLGDFLKQMREARDLSVEEVARETKISAEYIRALEAADFDALPPEIYVRGFIKSYGEFLGADLDDLFSRYEAEKPKPKARRIFSGRQKSKPPYESTIKKRKGGRKRVIPRRLRLNTSSVIIGLLIIAIVVAAIVIFTGGEGETAPTTSVNDVVSEDSAEARREGLTADLTETDLTQEIKLVLGDINPAWALGRADSLTLTIEVREESRVLVETDYRRAFKGNMEAGDTMSFRAKNAFFLTLGMPSATHITVNGFDLNEWPERNYPMDLEINRGNILQLLEGAEEIKLPRPPRPNIIGNPPEEAQPDSAETAPQPQIRTRTPGLGLGENTGVRDVDTPPPEGPPQIPAGESE